MLMTSALRHSLMHDCYNDVRCIYEEVSEDGELL